MNSEVALRWNPQGKRKRGRPRNNGGDEAVNRGGDGK